MLKIFLAFAVMVAQAQEKPEPPKPRVLMLLPDDEPSLRVVCEAARTAPTLNLESASNVIGYCITLLTRVRQAQSNTPQPLK